MSRNSKSIYVNVISVIVVLAVLLCANIVVLNRTEVPAQEINSTESASSDIKTTTAVTTVSTTEYKEPVKLEFPYLIEIDKGSQIVTVFTTNEEGKYEKIVRQMICSTGEVIDKFPDGYYTTKNKHRWQTMLSTTDKHLYAQYTTKITGHFLFHSVPYTATRIDALDWKRYNNLGTRASGGCIRLTVESAKWIYENVPQGTTVHVVTGEPRPDLLETLRPPKLTAADKYDPTDPEGPNPITMYPNPDPQPDPYAELYPYNFEYSPEVPATRRTTTKKTTVPVTTNSPTSSNAAKTTTKAPDISEEKPED